MFHAGAGVNCEQHSHACARTAAAFEIDSWTYNVHAYMIECVCAEDATGQRTLRMSTNVLFANLGRAGG
jgi:hypothetical protein